MESANWKSEKVVPKYLIYMSGRLYDAHTGTVPLTILPNPLIQKKASDKVGYSLLDFPLPRVNLN